MSNVSSMGRPSQIKTVIKMRSTRSTSFQQFIYLFFLRGKQTMLKEKDFFFCQKGEEF